MLPYRGLGSGIKRALEDWPAIDFTDDRDGCLFTVTVHRKELAIEEGTNISSEEIVAGEKSSEEITIGEKSSEELISGLKRSGRSYSEEIILGDNSSEKSSEEILLLLKADPAMPAREIAHRLEISRRAVEKQIAKFREDGRIHRIGPDKGGHWEVLK